MIFCLGRTVRILPLLMSLVTVCWFACAFCAKVQVAEGKPEAARNVVRTTICEVVSNPGSFDGKIIELRADVFAGLETNILYDKNCGSKGRLPTRILFVESSDVPRTDRSKEYRKFWNLVQAYRKSKGRRHSIVPDKYTVTATVIGRFDAASPSRPEIASGGQLVLKSVRDVVAHAFDGSFLAGTKPNSSAETDEALPQKMKPQ